mmetsp:Transcript_2934/g.11883  ORF Transcript_2934/g.11883 Transcript_2934/m.11883 type:complete len:518 (-) Transcript_2934:169-1722(-)
MCTDDYLTEHPCDEPYTIGDDGLCSKLVEDALWEHGPSRLVFSVFVGVVSLACLLTQLRRLRILWLEATQRANRERSFAQWLLVPSTQMNIFLTYLSILLLIHSVDIFGYGGRLHFVFAMLVMDQATFAVVAVVVHGLAGWWRTALRICHAHIERWLLILSWSTVLLCGVDLSLMSFLGIHMRPVDGTLGVINGFIDAAKLFILAVVIISCQIFVVAVFVHMQKLLREGNAVMTTSTTAGRSPTSRRDGNATDAPRGNDASMKSAYRGMQLSMCSNKVYVEATIASSDKIAPAPRGSTPRRINVLRSPTAARASLVSGSEGDAGRGTADRARRSSIVAPALEDRPTASFMPVATKNYTLYQLGKHVAVILVFGTLGLMLIMARIVVRLENCWIWPQTPEKYQWYNEIVAVQLGSLVFGIQANTKKSFKASRRTRLSVSSARVAQRRLATDNGLVPPPSSCMPASLAGDTERRVAPARTSSPASLPGFACQDGGARMDAMRALREESTAPLRVESMDF